MDLNKYFSRVGYKGCCKLTDVQTLSEIMYHHILAIPFENLSVHCREPISLNIESIFQKLVLKQRGGWCSEQNHLLFWVLKTIGYDVVMLAAHVHQPHLDEYNPFATHLLLKVTIDSKVYIADVGFGASSQIWQPLELSSGMDQLQVPGIFRLTESNGTWFLDKIRRTQMVSDGSCSDSELLDKSSYKKIHCFTLQEKTIDYFLESCRFHQTSPKSAFANKSVCSLQVSDGVRTLVGWTYTETKYNYRKGVDLVELKTLQHDEVETVLKENFGVVLESQFVVANNPGRYTI
ncbi:PREDICTED: arylamine N-acetyltransferase, pineal gland isozyme NAT-10-like [Nanorana parkeri]|uniref:arylamine N-acetyltransferase, pineal gland isozyme NAT-10-like n=1 Tax=Nanorana parkeri TaxID=125878 RepID=UPI0008548917|nr:PREDICTED: arylamine N-acetyltransferase, pineal gland isozyme NAT-10-like [Nanorana parkeri]